MEEKLAAEVVLQRTKNWVERFVVGLNICPFAGKVLQKGLVHFAYSAAIEVEDLNRDLIQLLEELLAVEPEELDTAILVHPHALQDFEAYLDFVADLQDRLAGSGLEGVVQVATFHPAYQFAGEAADAPSNYSNRSPFPMLHLLRESSVGAAVDAHPDVEGIPERNIRLLEEMGLEEVRRVTDLASGAAER